MTKYAVIVDFDGTITNGEDVPSKWTLNTDMYDILKGLFATTGYDFILATHRHVSFRASVKSFLQRNGLGSVITSMYFREVDEEEAVDTKKKIVDTLYPIYDIQMVFDDDEECCGMYAEELNCSVFQLR